MSTTEQDETSTPAETKAKSPEKAEEKILGATSSEIVVVEEAMDIDPDESKEEVIILQVDKSEEDENKCSISFNTESTTQHESIFRSKISSFLDTTI